MRELIELKKIAIATYDHNIHIFNPISGKMFLTIEIPKGFSSSPSMAYSAKQNIIFTAGFDQTVF